ncbi:MAG: class I SAM-dependent methyltransferase [Thermoplasmata archaeon]|nr:class I SAM-dependent methyltransferase [Thermoplasmata archaeon]
MSQEDVWDSFYRSNGRAWRGSCRLPDPLSGEGDALDIGCGSGKSTSTLIEMGYRVTGTDLSGEAVALCGERFGSQGTFVKGDVLSLPFEDGSFDYAVAVHVLEHVPDGSLAQAFSEIARVLRPGGFLFVRDFAPGDLRADSRKDNEIEYFHRTPEEILAFADGFSVVSKDLVEERTRFGAVRRRSELLFKKVI